MLDLALPLSISLKSPLVSEAFTDHIQITSYLSGDKLNRLKSRSHKMLPQKKLELQIVAPSEK